MSERADDGTDEITQARTELTEAKTNGARSGQTWHQMLLHPSPSSSQLSYGSDTVPTEAEARSQPATPRNTRLFGDLDESATNCDSGNFSLSESGGKEKLAIAATSQVGTNEVHQRFVQLNTELYEAKTELLAYKYKWNEIRNEIELSWSKKLDKLLDEKNELVEELEALQKDLQRLNGPPVQGDATAGRELYNLRSELEDTKLRLDCKEQATVALKQTITEQHSENENLSLRLASLKKMLNEARSEVEKAKESRHWFREELHRCQIKNAKLKEFYLTLDHRLHREATDEDTLVITARTEPPNDWQTQLRVCQQAKEQAEQESMELAKEIKLLKTTADSRIAEVTERKQQVEKQNIELLTLIEQLHASLADHQWQLGKLAEKEQKTGETKSNYVTELEIRRSEIETLSAQLARECFTKRQIEVGVEKLKAQVKVLSINFATTYQRLTVQECDLTEFRTRNGELQDRCNLLVSEKQRLEGELAMCSQQQRTSQQQHTQLLDAFRAIQSKNLELELKLGQCVSGAANDEEPAPLIDTTLLRSSEATIGRLRQDISELERKFTQQSSPNASVRPAGRKRHKLCPKHGASCLNSGGQEDSEMRDLCVLLKAIESDNRRRLHRYEVNNRTLLKTVKEHARERKLAEKRTSELEQEHGKCCQLRCEMASLRERCLLLEADLESSQQEATALRTGKDRLFNLLQNNCLLLADGDVWASLKRAFKELHNQQHEHKENGRLREQLEGSSKKIAKLEASVEHWKLLTVDTQSNDVDELRSELAVKCLLLEDAHRAVERLEGESKSLQQSASLVAANEASINEQLDELNRLVRIQEIRLETAHERLQLYEESDRVLAASKERFFHYLQSLQDAILQERQEKCELQEEVRELRHNMVNAVGNNLQKFHLTHSSNGISGQRSASIASPDPKSLSTPSASSLDIDQLQALVEESSRKCCTLQPLNESVSSLRQEMDNLNCVLQSRGFPQHQQPNPRFPPSLMQELNDATNGYYGSR